MSNIEWTNKTKRCTACKRSLLPSAFSVDRSRVDGLSYVCRECRNARARAKYAPTPLNQRKPTGPPPLPRRDGDKHQARARVNHLVQQGRLPRPETQPCISCGHLGSDRRHEYHHHKGYAAEHHLDVVVMCATCHRKDHHG